MNNELLFCFSDLMRIRGNSQGWTAFKVKIAHLHLVGKSLLGACIDG